MECYIGCSVCMRMRVRVRVRMRVHAVSRERGYAITKECFIRNQLA